MARLEKLIMRAMREKRKMVMKLIEKMKGKMLKR
jgi:hypothetical protein